MFKRIRLALTALLLAACSRQPNDDLVTARIKASFFSDSELKFLDLRVAVDHGRVQLGGSVPSAEIRLKAFKLALYTEGVTNVLDKMAVIAPATGGARSSESLAADRKPAPVLPKPTPEPVVRSSGPAAESPAPSAEPTPAGPTIVVQPPAVSIQVAVPAPPPTAEPVATPGAPPAPTMDAQPPPTMVASAPHTLPAAVINGTILNAAGASLPAPLYATWFQEFRKIDPRVRITYEAIGSGGGIRLLDDGRIDFAGSDVALMDYQITAAHGQILPFPTALGGVALISNLPGIRGLNFTGEVLADIFSGRVTNWNDPAIARWNPRADLPNASITPVHRSDGTASTLMLTSYLSAVSPQWRASVGAATSVRWPVGLAGAQNAGVFELVKQSPYSIGYVDVSYALQNRVAANRVRNRSGVFIEPTLSSLTAAADAKSAETPADLRSFLVDASGPAAYPIASYTWFLVPGRFNEPAKRHALFEFLSWMLAAGQTYTARCGYAPLPKAIVAREQRQLSLVR